MISFFYIGKFALLHQKNTFLDFQTSTNSKNFTVLAKVIDILELSDSKMKYLLTLKTNKLIDEQDNKVLNSNVKMQLYINNKKFLEIGDLIEIKNLFFKPIITDKFEDYLIKENLFTSLFVYNFNYKLIKKEISFFKYLNELKNEVFQSLRRKLNPKTFALFSSIFLGNKNYLKIIDNAKNLFNIWGLSHYLARSGLHLIIIASIWYFILSIFFLSFKNKNIIIFLLIYLYHLFTWPSIPFIRSLFMFSFYRLCILLNLQINSFHLLNITTLIILILNPIQLFFLDFQLSFGLTYSLIWLSNIASKN